MSTSRQRILEQLQRKTRPFPEVNKPESYLPMVPQEMLEPAALRKLFVEMAEGAACQVYRPASQDDALETILQIITAEAGTVVSSWDFVHIPLRDLEGSLSRAGIDRVGEDASARVGITGADAALAATGSLVLCSGRGKLRAASLLPPVHIAVLDKDLILPDLESWWALQRRRGLEQMRQMSNIVLITGPSRTADIAMQLVMGMHGPREVHIVLV